ncbi:MAG: TrbG/VirB9 family P-type conjugative transfer protein, partial [Flavobacteriales bacterium]|nr:TrbG/VirB9 family P-type conjugative transfer protein [Flavobacteriales bacterium]
AETNLLVLTNKRSYHFELRAHDTEGPGDRSVTYAVKFHYLDEELNRSLERGKEVDRLRDTLVVPDRSLSPESLNFHYTMKGSDVLAPIRTFDDGEFTFFQFPGEIDTPAIFLVNRQNEESIVNYHVRGNFIVVERIASRFILRSGKEATCIYNEGYAARIEPSELAEYVKAKNSPSVPRPGGKPNEQ